MLGPLDASLRRYGVPRLPGDIGLTEEQFVAAVARAPSTRPDRYTILEHLDLNEDEIQERVAGFVAPSIAELRTVTQPESLLARGGRRALGRPALHAACVALRHAPAAGDAADRQRRDGAHDPGGLLAALALTLPGVLPAAGAVALVQLQLLLDCCDGEVARWRRTFSPAGVYLDQIAHYSTEAALLRRVRGPGRRRVGFRRRMDGPGLAVSVLILLLKAETHLVLVARSRRGGPFPRRPRDAPARGTGRLRLRDTSVATPSGRFTRWRRRCSLLVAAVADAAQGSSSDSRCSCSSWWPRGLIAVAGHLLAVLASDRLK